MATTVGAVNVGVALPAPENITAGPAVCTQLYVSTSASGSMLSVPSSVTCVPSLRVWSGPALAIGPWLTFSTVTCTVSADDSAPSLTVSSNVSVAPDGATNGAVKLGCAVFAPLRLTAGPSVCTQLNVTASLS